mmetsp:Transcript_4908/g.14216  ORF Transcript_4908/g.14216 Transcript_4908/m.14216 type:complete len:274 (+) Transcript_4908:100-921(+)
MNLFLSRCATSVYVFVCCPDIMHHHHRSRSYRWIFSLAMCETHTKLPSLFSFRLLFCVRLETKTKSKIKSLHCSWLITPMPPLPMIRCHQPRPSRHYLYRFRHLRRRRHPAMMTNAAVVTCLSPTGNSSACLEQRMSAAASSESAAPCFRMLGSVPSTSSALSRNTDHPAVVQNCPAMRIGCRCSYYWHRTCSASTGCADVPPSTAMMLGRSTFRRHCCTPAACAAPCRTCGCDPTPPVWRVELRPRASDAVPSPPAFGRSSKRRSSSLRMPS